MSNLNLNDYILQEELGSGSFGQVCKVKDKNTGNIYAAKIAFRPLKESSESDIRSFSREVNILSQINHPAILGFIGYSPVNFSNKPFPVIITEYISNGSLLDIINLERQSTLNSKWNDTRKLVNIYGIASAMAYLHSHNIIHRDLKPANILIDNFLCPKVADFGLSKVIHSNEDSMIASQSTNAIKGTPIYIAPEVWREMNYSPACDVYAYGIIIYEIITKLEPYKCKAPFEIISKIVNGERPFIDDDVPLSYRTLIERCWDQNPEKRPTFDEICNEIRTNKDFITENVIESDFLAYVDFLDKSPKEFKEKEKAIQIDEFMNHKTVTFKPIKINELSSSIDKKMLFPIKQFRNLPKECQQMVEEANEDPEKQFEIGESLIKGINNFPLNTEIGIKYIDKSAKNGCLESAIYYSRLLIEDEIIPQDLEKAKSILDNFESDGNSEVMLLYGKIMKKENDFQNAKKKFELSAKAGNPEAMYEFGKLLYKGVGCSKNEKDANSYFAMAKRNGFNKGERFIAKQNSSNSQQNLQNKLPTTSYSQTNIPPQQINAQFSQPNASYSQPSPQFSPNASYSQQNQQLQQQNQPPQMNASYSQQNQPPQMNASYSQQNQPPQMNASYSQQNQQPQMNASYSQQNQPFPQSNAPYSQFSANAPFSQPNASYNQQNMPVLQPPNLQYQLPNASYSQPNIPFQPPFFPYSQSGNQYQQQNGQFPQQAPFYPQPNAPISEPSTSYNQQNRPVLQHSTLQYQLPTSSYSQRNIPIQPPLNSPLNSPQPPNYNQQTNANPTLQYRLPNASYSQSNIPFQQPPSLPKERPADPCTFIKTGKKMVKQKLFKCLTCKMKDDDCMCEACARICHADHDVRVVGSIGGFCDCGAGSLACRCLCINVKSKDHVPAFVPGPCTYNKTGEKLCKQKLYKCITCGFDDGNCCCEACANICHKGHKVVPIGIIDGFCDCGACAIRNCVLCKCVRIPNPKL